MVFNSKNIVSLGILIFILQLINFFSIDEINPQIERAQVLAALSAIIIILIGLLFERFTSLSGERVDLQGENSFFYESTIPEKILDELAWGSEAILTSTAAASILINNSGRNILKRGVISKKNFIPGEICLKSLKSRRLISLVNTKFYPGKDEFNDFCQDIPSILIIPINEKSFILVGGWSSRCFTRSDEKWIKNWAKKLEKLFLEINF
tara:strand:- start:2068 stop:2694 length:627 start_codon:yes stop_codon:yes gene_type:complete